MGVRISHRFGRSDADTVTMFHEIVDDIIEFEDDVKERIELLLELADAGFASREVRSCFFKVLYIMNKHV